MKTFTSIELIEWLEDEKEVIKDCYRMKELQEFKSECKHQIKELNHLIEELKRQESE